MGIIICLLALVWFEVIKFLQEWQGVNWKGQKVERKKGSFTPIIRGVNMSVILVLLYFTFNPIRQIHAMTEQEDWTHFYETRTQVVKQVDARLLYPDNYTLSGYCRLPKTFPIVSNGGNQIYITKDPLQDAITVSFFIHLGFFEGYNSAFIYTNNPEHIEKLEERIRENPESNWKIQNNWYRTVTRDFPPV